MIRSGWGSARPRRLVLVAAAVLIPVLAGCEAGNNAPTLAFHYPTDAAGTVVGDLSIRNVFVLGAPLGSSLHPGQSASVFLALVDNGAPDTLLSITAPGSAASVTLPSATVPVRVGRPVFYTGPRPQVALIDLSRIITSGSTIRLVLTFQKAGPVTLLVPVVPRAANAVTFAPPQPIVTPTITPSPAAKHHKGSATPGASTTASPGATASPTPSAIATPSPSPS